MTAIVIFDMDQRRFCPHDMDEPIPPGCHKASLGVFNGPYAFKGATRAADEMQATYIKYPNPLANRRACQEMLYMLFLLHRYGKIPTDFSED